MELSVVLGKIQTETKQLHSFSGFFQSIKKNTDKYANSLIKDLNGLKLAVSSVSGWSNNIQSFFSHYTGILSALNKYSNSIATSIIQPLDIFTTNYESNNKKTITEASKIIENINSQKKKINKLKEQYTKEHKLLLNYKEEDVYKMKLKRLGDIREEYCKLVVILNSSIEPNKAKYDKLLAPWIKQEEYKIKYIKAILNMLSGFFEELNSSCLLVNESAKKTVESFNLSFDLKNFVMIDEEKVFIKTAFELPGLEHSAGKAPEEFLLEVFPRGITEEDLKFEEGKLKELMGDRSISETERSKLYYIIQNKKGLYTFFTQLVSIIYELKLNNSLSFTTLTQLIVSAADLVIEDKEPAYVCAILNACNLISHERKYIKRELRGHPLWDVKKLWNEVIEYRIDKELECLTQSKVNLMVKRNVSVGKQEMNIKSGIYFKVLSSTVLDMAFYSVDKSLCYDIIMKYANEGKIEFEKLYQILIDYDFIQPKEKHKHKQISEYLLKKKERKSLKYGHALIIKLSIDYINDIKSLRNILLSNKYCYKLLKYKVYRAMLGVGGSEIRFNIWRTLLYSSATKYSAIEKLDTSTEKGRVLEEAIRLDVIRSFYKYSELEQNAIINILQAYATFDKSVEYCQGMNCIAGFLYLICKDEETAFNMMWALFYKYELVNLFEQDKPHLKALFYQLNKLIAILLPCLHSHLSHKALNSTYFSSAWFLTAFTYVIQNSKSIPLLVLRIFDEFIISGSKGLLKTAIFLLEYFEEKLIKCDNIVKFLAEVPKTNFFECTEVLKKYEEKIKGYNITKHLLNKLASKHKELYGMAEKRGVVKRVDEVVYVKDGEEVYMINLDC